MTDASGNQPPPYGSSQPPYGTSQPPYGSSQPPYGSYPPPPPNYPGGGGNDGEMQGASGLSALALSALLVGLLLPFIGILIAVPLGVAALVRISKSRQTGKKLAILGIVFSVLWWVGFMAFAIILSTQGVTRDSSGVITEEGKIDYGEIREGDCLHITDLDKPDDVDPTHMQGVRCEQAHNAEAAGILTVSGDSYPGQSALEDKAGQECPVKVNDYAPDVDPAGLKLFQLMPTEGVWDEDGGHRVICFIVQEDLSDTNSSVTD